MTAASQQADICFHCGDNIPKGADYRADIDGAERRFCCIGCQSVALMIRGADLTAFYQQRTDYTARPTTETSGTAEWFDDRKWVQSFATTTPDGTTRLPLLVSGMTCAACTWLIEKVLQPLPGILDVDINLNLSRLTLKLEKDASAAPAIELIEKLGYSVRPWRTDDRLNQLRDDNRKDIRRLGVAGLGMMQAGMFAIALHAGDLQGIDVEMQSLLRWFSAPIALFVLFYSGRTFLSNAWKSLLQKHLIMDSSVSLALLLATGASLFATVRGSGETYYDSVTMFVFLLLLARYVEKRLRNADLLSLVRIEDRLPEFVAVRVDDQWQRTPRAEVVVGALVRVPAGEAVAFDGIVEGGDSVVDEAVFTGEAVPRAVSPGDRIYAGTINRDASIEAVVNSSYRDSRLASLQDDVDRARRDKPPYLRLIDQIAGRFVAVVLLAATATGLFWFQQAPERALWTALAVLVVACPCALSLATPAAVASATAWLRRHNVLVHGEFGLLAAAEATTLFIDKTGTLTETDFALEDIQLAPGADRQTVIGLASALQQFSNHPAALPFHAFDTYPGVEHVESVPGCGMYGRLGDRQLRLGSAAFCRELTDLPAAPNESSYWVALVDDRGWLAWLGLSERLRPGALQLVERMQRQGITTRIVSGDTVARVARIAEQLGVEYDAAATPAGKLDSITAAQQRGETVIAAGDGLNDAPLLSAADASIAVANATALTRAQADFAVDEADLTLIPTIVDISRRNRRIIRENLIWAAGYNLLGIPFAALGYVPPWLAAVGMSLSSLLVVLNALRLRRFRKPSV